MLLDELIYKGGQLIIPGNMIGEITEALHYAHQGFDTMIRTARDTVYWLQMKDDVKRMADECTRNPRNQNQPLRLHDVPHQQFAKVSTDVLYHQGRP